jgi:hypothetical protein
MAGVSTKRIQEVSEILWGFKRLVRHALKAHARGLRCRPLTGKYPYVY